MKLYVIEKKRIKSIGFKLFWILLLLLCIVYFSKSAVGVFSIPMRSMVVVIDAGHGGNDPGASGRSGVSEKNINLQIALKLRRLVEQGGGTAIMIREDDRGLYTEGKDRIGTKKSEDLKNRHMIINNSGADAFVSIHLNSFPQSQYYGAQTFYQQGDEKSKVLAEFVQQELRDILGRGNDRVVKSTNDVYLLRNNNLPGVLVECGFLSNAEEEKLLQDEHYQEKIAWSIFTGVMKYFEQEHKVKATIEQ